MTEKNQSTQFIILSNGDLRQVPDGAEAEAFRRVQEAGLNPPKRRRKSSSGRKSSKRNHSAASVLGRTSTFEQEAERHKSTAELVKRVNNDREGEEEPGSPRFVTLHGQITTLEIF